MMYSRGLDRPATKLGAVVSTLEMPVSPFVNVNFTWLFGIAHEL